jgi:DNA-binding NarL/FixJ family response regulator
VSIRVIVVDDQELVLVGLSGIIDSAPDVTVIGQADSGRRAVELAAKLQPDVVVMDVRMPGMDGIEATRHVTQTTDARVLILTTFDLDDYVYGALRAGASGFLLKDTPPTELLSAIRVIAGGEALLAPGVTRRLLDEFAARTSAPAPAKPVADPRLGAITSREREVLVLVGEGLSNAEIAARLYIGAGTAKSHVSSLLSKLGARDRIQLVILSHDAGLT